MELTFFVEDNLDEFIAGNDSIIKYQKSEKEKIVRKRDSKKK